MGSAWTHDCWSTIATLCFTIKKLQRVQNNRAARIVLQASSRSHAKPLLHQLHWLPVQQRITYKLAVLTNKVRSKSTPVYLHRRIAERACSRTLRSSAIPLLDKPFMRTDFSRCDFRSSAPTVWNSLPQTVSDSLTVLKSRLKTFQFNQDFTEHWSDLPPAPLKLRPYGAIEIRLLLLLLLWCTDGRCEHHRRQLFVSIIGTVNLCTSFHKNILFPSRRTYLPFTGRTSWKHWHVVNCWN